MYADSRQPIKQLKDVGVEIPAGFKIVAEFVLSKQFNDLIVNAENIFADSVIQKGLRYLSEAQNLSVNLNKDEAKKLFEGKIMRNLVRLAENFEQPQAAKLMNILSVSKQLDIQPNIREAQNYYFKNILKIIPQFFEELENSEDAKGLKQLINYLLNIGEMLDFDVKEEYIKLSNIKL